MIRIAVVGDIGSGKSHVAKQFGYPVFNADKEVSKLYKKNKKCFNKLKKKIPKYIDAFPIKKTKILKAISDNNNNLKKIIKVIHPEVRLKLNAFIKKNKNKKIIVLDIPLFLENKMNRESDILIFVEAKKTEVIKRLKKRFNYNFKIIKKFKKLQLPVERKKRISDYIIKNNFNNKFVKKNVKITLKKIFQNA
tara:strand:+ start:480 stop:1058 length:579 start_codon:yes stop_codon:yes gene_type:complete